MTEPLTDAKFLKNLLRCAASTRKSVCAVIVLENCARLSFRLKPFNALNCNIRHHSEKSVEVNLQHCVSLIDLAA